MNDVDVNRLQDLHQSITQQAVTPTLSLAVSPAASAVVSPAVSQGGAS
jgi:hypothetical protein